MHNKDKKLEQLINEHFNLFRKRVGPKISKPVLKLKHPLVEEFPEQLRLFLETPSELQTTVLEYARHVYELHKMAYSSTTTNSTEDYWAELLVCLLEVKRHILTEYPESNQPLMRRLIYPDFEELTAPNIESGVKKAHWDKQNDKLALFEEAMVKVPREFKPSGAGQKMKADSKQIDELYLPDIIRIANELIQQKGRAECVTPDETAKRNLYLAVHRKLETKCGKKKPAPNTVKNKINRYVLAKK